MAGTPLMPVDEAVEQLLAASRLLAGTTEVRLTEAAGHVLARDVVSTIDVPPAANSSMDGYAISTADAHTVAGKSLPVSDRIAAGQVGKPLAPGSAARVFTGAPLPPGADAVVMQENTAPDGDDRVILNQLAASGENVRPAGQDIKRGTTVLEKGRRLRPADVAVAASVGVDRLAVFEPLRIAIMSTGDELVDPPAPLSPGQIYNANHYALTGLIEELGMAVVDLGLVPDDRNATESALLRGAESADVIISSGGVSVGEEDYVKAALEQLGRLELWRIAIKPGKPLAFGEVQGTPFFGLPGNPVSTFVTFTMIAAPCLLKAQGASTLLPPHIVAVADFEMPAGSRREYVRVRLRADDDGTLRVSSYGNQGSGVMSSVSWANALAEVDIGQQVRYGDCLKIFPMKGWLS